MAQFKGVLITIGLALIFTVGVAFQSFKNEMTIKEIQKKSDTAGFAVIELFTSEGCSSCPPADELIERLQAGNQNNQLYILALHVDYWDHQGWRDPFSQPEFTWRQKEYADKLKLKLIYTPQIVVNGNRELVGSEQGELLSAVSSAIKTTANDPSPAILELKATLEGKNLNVDYAVAGLEKDQEILIALVQKHAKSAVKAGENSGRTLSHVQIVRELYHRELKDKNNMKIVVPQDFNIKNWELVAFVQNKTNGQISKAARAIFGS